MESYRYIFKEKLSIECDEGNPNQSISSSIKIPKALRFSTTHEFPVVKAEAMYDGYVDRVLTESVLLMLLELGITSAEQSLINHLLELIKQSMRNIGEFLSTTNLSMQSHSDYFLLNYEIQPSLLSQTMNEFSFIYTGNKRDYSSFSPSPTIQSIVFESALCY